MPKQWCSLCTLPSIMLTLEEAASVFGEDMPLVQRLTDSGAVHFTHDALGGAVDLCEYSMDYLGE